jgi:diketogulonate reductase-like aldo/keto reductase
MQPTITVQGVAVPRFFYGTAWKEERTAELTALALEAGFTAIDTANQRKHYHEAGVGKAIAASGRKRASLFLQTKFTYVAGQDHRLPYDPEAPPATQVEQSFNRSLAHLATDRLDSYLLHGPWSGRGWTDIDREVWYAMETLHAEGRTSLIGVSNVSPAHLRALCEEADVLPAFVQNRCYARTGWDREIRALCREHGIVYQGFSLLTANRTELASPRVQAIADRLGATIPQVVFRFAMALGMIPLTGTTDPRHMAEDLASADLELTGDDLATLERLAG